jgi:hypothetical protein
MVSFFGEVLRQPPDTSETIRPIEAAWIVFAFCFGICECLSGVCEAVTMMASRATNTCIMVASKAWRKNDEAAPD